MLSRKSVEAYKNTRCKFKSTVAMYDEYKRRLT